MSFPYTYKSICETDLSPKKIFIKLEKNFESKKLRNLIFFQNKINFDIETGLFGLKTNVSLEFKLEKTGFYYEFSLLNLIKAIIVLIIISAFIFKSITNLLIYPTIGVSLLYSIVIFHIKTKLEDLFSEFYENYSKAEILSENQKKWMQNPDVCPGCGEKLIPEDAFCPECGLNLSKHRKAKPDKSSRNAYFDFRIEYSGITNNE